MIFAERRAKVLRLSSDSAKSCGPRVHICGLQALHKSASSLSRPSGRSTPLLAVLLLQRPLESNCDKLHVIIAAVVLFPFIHGFLS